MSLAMASWLRLSAVWLFLVAVDADLRDMRLLYSDSGSMAGSPTMLCEIT